MEIWGSGMLHEEHMAAIQVRPSLKMYQQPSKVQTDRLMDTLIYEQHMVAILVRTSLKVCRQRTVVWNKLE